MSDIMKLRNEKERLEKLVQKKDKLIEEFEEESELQTERIQKLEDEITRLHDENLKDEAIQYLQEVLCVCIITAGSN